MKDEDTRLRPHLCPSPVCKVSRWQTEAKLLEACFCAGLTCQKRQLRISGFSCISACGRRFHAFQPLVVIIWSQWFRRPPRKKERQLPWFKSANRARKMVLGYADWKKKTPLPSNQRRRPAMAGGRTYLKKRDSFYNCLIIVLFYNKQVSACCHPDSAQHQRFNVDCTGTG